MNQIEHTTDSGTAESRAALAHHVSAVLTHPDTPPYLYEAISDALCALSVPTHTTISAEYISALLEHNAPQRKKVNR
jgi:hypothetical protein